MNAKKPQKWCIPALNTRITSGIAAACTSVCTAFAAPIKVDTELLLLVDVSGSVTETDYNFMLGAYGRAMSSSAVLNAIQSGQTGKIATAVVFWSSANRQAVGVNWMEVSDLTSAQQFSNNIIAATRPWSGGKTAIGTAINYGTSLFGTETGSAENGFSSLTQIIDVAGDGIDNATGPRVVDRSVNVEAERNAALSAGVDMINGLTINDPTGSLAQYYQTHVIGGGTSGKTAFVMDSPDYASFENALTLKLASEINAGATQSKNNLIPEPSVVTVTSLASIFLFRRRRSGPREKN